MFDFEYVDPIDYGDPSLDILWAGQPFDSDEDFAEVIMEWQDPVIRPPLAYPKTEPKTEHECRVAYMLRTGVQVNLEPGCGTVESLVTHIPAQQVVAAGD